MVLYMKRDSVQTVAFPILIEAKPKDADDWGTFFPENWEGSMFVRVVTPKDVTKWISQLSASEKDMLIGLSHLKVGLDENDEYTLARGYQILQPLVKDLASPAEWSVGIPTSEGKKLTLRSRGQKWNATHYNYSRLLTRALRNSRFVVWCSLEKYRRVLPALFCKDLKTAIYAMRIAGPLRFCPNCDLPFVPAAENVIYYPSECRERYRVKRFRWREKQGRQPEVVDSETKIPNTKTRGK